jgi:hypothetical protein
MSLKRSSEHGTRPLHDPCTAGKKKRRVPTDKSRGWTPLKYPSSAILSTATTIEVQSFPLHNDVLLAAVRELLILDGILDGKTLEVSHLPKVRCSQCIEGRNPRKTVLSSSSHSSTGLLKQNCKHGRKRGRENAKMNCHLKDSIANKHRNRSSRNEHVISRRRKPTAEAIAHSIIENARVVDAEPSNETSNTIEEANHWLATSFGAKTERRPRAVSEADQSSNCLPAPPTPKRYFTDSSDVTADVVESADISQVLNLKQNIKDGRFDLLDRREILPEMIHLSISDEEILRVAARQRTRLLVQPFSNHALRSFFGYKISGIDRERLVHLLAGLLFDVSHAMYAWEQTEHEILASRGCLGGPDGMQQMTVDDVDDLVLEALFGRSERALKRVGGFETSSLLPNAISIGRLRLRNVSWTYFASTARGLRMLEHHKSEESRIWVGKQRRGHRSRQYGLSPCEATTRNAYKPEHFSSMGTICVPASSSASLASEDEVKDVVVFDARSIVGIPTNSKYTHLLEHVPGCLAFSITRPDGDSSWGVGLLKEGDVCVVGRVGNETSSAPNDADCNALVCGDLILFAQNEDGKFACSPLCAASSSLPGGIDNTAYVKHEDWYRSLVDLFKNSHELQLIVQRVT